MSFDEDVIHQEAQDQSLNRHGGGGRRKQLGDADQKRSHGVHNT
jgi:hypothetical protein